MSNPHRRYLLTLWPEYLPEGVILKFPCINDTAINHEKLLHLTVSNPEVRYFGYCLEEGEEAGHEHLQGYMELRTPQRYSFFSPIFGKQHHYEACKGSQEDCIDYCKHEGRHKDKSGKLGEYHFSGQLAKPGIHEGGVFDTAVALAFDGLQVSEIVRCLGGSVLSQVGNLSKLVADIDAKKNRAGKQIENNAIQQLKIKEMEELRSENAMLKLQLRDILSDPVISDLYGIKQREN